MRTMTMVTLLAAAHALFGCQPDAGEPTEEPRVVETERVVHQVDPEDRIELTLDGHPSVGPSNAPITLVYVTSFTCPFCARSRVTLRQLREEYGDELRVVTRYRLAGPEPRLPALAACAAHRQGQFHAYSDQVWETVLEGGELTDEQLGALAVEVGMDGDRFREDLLSDECAASIDAEDQTLLESGLRATPSWVINGRLVRGAQPIGVFREMIDEELGRESS